MHLAHAAFPDLGGDLIRAETGRALIFQLHAKEVPLETLHDKC